MVFLASKTRTLSHKIHFSYRRLKFRKIESQMVSIFHRLARPGHGCNDHRRYHSMLFVLPLAVSAFNRLPAFAAVQAG